MHAVFFLELGGVVLGLAVLARAAGRFGFPPIPLYLLAGLVIGRGGIFPVATAEEFIEGGANIGVVLLLFMLGLEYSADELRDNLRAATRAGAFDLVTNFVPGFAAGLVLDLGVVPAVLLGGVTYMSSTGVIAKLLDDLDWIANRETPVVLSILVIEDLLMAVYLPIVAILLVGGGITTTIVSLVVALVAVIAILLVAFRWGDKMSKALFSPSDETMLLSLLGLLLVVAGLAERAHVSAAVGAFLVGIAVSGPAAERARGLLSPLRDLFAAVFFVFFGLQIDPGSIPPVLVAAFVLALVTGATKVWTGIWSARRSGIGRRGQVRAGTVLVARGEFSIAIAGIGVAAGVPARFGALVAAYVLLLGVIGPISARVADPIVARRARAGAAVPASPSGR